MVNQIEYVIHNDPTLNGIAKKLLEAYKSRLDERDANATGSLKNSAAYTIDAQGGHVILYFILNHYWYYLEFGPRQHFPPVSAIENWIEVKGIVPRAKKGKRGKDLKVPSARQLAYAICKKMEYGKTNPDGRRVAYIEKPALRDVIDGDPSGLVTAFVNRVSEIYAETLHQQIEVTLNSLNSKTTPIQDFFIKQMR